MSINMIYHSILSAVHFMYILDLRGKKLTRTQNLIEMSVNGEMKIESTKNLPHRPKNT